MKLTINQLHRKLKYLGIMSIEDNTPITFTGFKNRTTIYRYPRNKRIVFIGRGDNVFGFYTDEIKDILALKDAYKMFVKLVKGDYTLYEDKKVQWGNTGIPLVYRPL